MWLCLDSSNQENTVSPFALRKKQVNSNEGLFETVTSDHISVPKVIIPEAMLLGCVVTFLSSPSV